MQSWVFTIEYVSCDFIWGFFMLYIIFWRGSNCVRNFHVPPFCSQRQPKPAPCSQDSCSAGNHSTGISAMQRLLGFCRNCTILRCVAEKYLLRAPWSSLEDCVLLWQGTFSSFSGLFLKTDETRMEKCHFIPLLEHGSFCWSSVWVFTCCKWH